MAGYNPDRLVQPLAHVLDYYERKLSAANWRDAARLRPIVLDYYDCVLGIPRTHADLTDEDIAHVNATNARLEKTTGRSVPPLVRRSA